VRIRNTIGTEKLLKWKKLAVGEPAPWFFAREKNNPQYGFDTAAGRYLILCFFGSAGLNASETVFSEVLNNHRILFDDKNFSFFGVTIDPKDEPNLLLKTQSPGIRFFFDFDLAISRLYGSAPLTHGTGERPFRCQWVILDPTMRILKILPLRQEDVDCKEVLDFLTTLPPVNQFSGVELQAPILYLTNIFEPALCANLIDLYGKHGGEDSGYMRDVDGKTVKVLDYGYKRRRDVFVTDEPVLKEIHRRILRRIAPEIKKVHHFDATHIERNLVACYSAEERGHFRPHRDNTTRGTLHRRFAVTINLNSDFEGGELSFPEYGTRSFNPPPGGAIVFSCSLMHRASPVTKGKRFAFLPFLYDDAAKKVREENREYLEEQ
jgi:predicted 2-oxoglutarate/Fe(II)-dependent dioxygenase YbiX/peroxiredoxin